VIFFCKYYIDLRFILSFTRICFKAVLDNMYMYFLNLAADIQEIQRLCHAKTELFLSPTHICKSGQNIAKARFWLDL